MLSLKQFLFVMTLTVVATAPVLAAGYAKVLVVDPYLELHTGPGEGYPVTQVVERGEWIEVLKRRTDWFKIRTSSGIEGWTPRQQIETTMTESGVQTTLRDILEDDYRRRRMEAGVSIGTLDGDTTLTVRLGYRINDNFTTELALGQASGDYSTTDAYYGSLAIQPFPDWRVAPFFSMGLGKYKNKPKATLVGAIETDSNMATVALGANVYLTRRFYVRGEYRRFIAYIDENRNWDYNEMSVGIGFFFH